MTHQVKHIYKNASVKFQFIADVEFGVPSRNCRNFGICRINPTKNSKSLSSQTIDDQCKGCKKDKHVKSVISIMNNDVVEISFLKFYINELDYYNHFNTGKFIVEEDFDFSMEGKPTISFKIKKGLYSVKLNETFITVVFENKS